VVGLLLFASSSDAQSLAAAAREPTTLPARDSEIRPFSFQVSDAELAELRRRITATGWPEKETVGDHSQGVPLGAMRELARYWATASSARLPLARRPALK
jgi:hypothetical protein